MESETLNVVTKNAVKLEGKERHEDFGIQRLV